MPHYANDSKKQQFSSNAFSHFESGSNTVYDNRSIPVKLPSFQPIPERTVIQWYFWSDSGPAKGSVLTLLLRWTDVQGFIS